MRKLNSIEKPVLVLAVLLTAVGFWAALFPNEFVGRYIANDHVPRDSSYIMTISKSDCRNYGILCLGAGVFLVGAVFYPWKK